VSQICEEFPGTLPTRALWELEHDPDCLVLTIIRLRAYARTKAQIEAAKTSDEMPTGPMADLVTDIMTDLTRARVERAIAARLAAGEES